MTWKFKYGQNHLWCWASREWLPLGRKGTSGLLVKLLDLGDDYRGTFALYNLGSWTVMRSCTYFNKKFDMKVSDLKNNIFKINNDTHT